MGRTRKDEGNKFLSKDFNTVFKILKKEPSPNLNVLVFIKN